jgi:hypothetical protein
MFLWQKIQTRSYAYVLRRAEIENIFISLSVFFPFFANRHKRRGFKEEKKLLSRHFNGKSTENSRNLITSLNGRWSIRLSLHRITFDAIEETCIKLFRGQKICFSRCLNTRCCKSYKEEGIC